MRNYEIVNIFLSSIGMIALVVTLFLQNSTLRTQQRQVNEQTLLVLLGKFRERADKSVYIDPNGKQFEGYEAFSELLRNVDSLERNNEEMVRNAPPESPPSAAALMPRITIFFLIGQMKNTKQTMSAYLTSLFILLQYLNDHQLPAADKEFYLTLIKSNLSQAEMKLLRRLPELSVMGSGSPYLKQMDTFGTLINTITDDDVNQPYR